MSKDKSLYAIYKYDFHKAVQRTVEADVNGKDGKQYLRTAQRCYASLFDPNTVCITKTGRNGDTIRLPNDVLAKSGDIFVWRVNNSKIKEWWRWSGKDSRGIDTYEKQDLESNPYCNVLIDNRKGRCLMAIEKSAAWNCKPDLLRDMLLENFNRLLADRFDLEMRIEARMNPIVIWDYVYDCIFGHQDNVRRVAFSFQNPKKMNKQKAYYPLASNIIHDFCMGVRLLSGKTALEEWFDTIEKQTERYVNESDVPKRSNKARQTAQAVTVHKLGGWFDRFIEQSPDDGDGDVTEFAKGVSAIRQQIPNAPINIQYVNNQYNSDCQQFMGRMDNPRFYNCNER